VELARRILGSLSRGVEIGASAIAPFPGVRAWNLEQPGAALFQEAQLRLAGRVAPVHVLGTAERLPFGEGRLDFLLASHVIEHMPDTIRALGEWDRALRAGGILFLIVPHRLRTFDRDRPRTDLRHHLADYALGNTARSDPLVPTSHYHVWETADFLALLAFLGERGFLDWSIEEVEDVDSRAGNGFTVVARKRGRPVLRPSLQRGTVAFHQLTLRLPFQVPGRSLETIVPGAELPERPPVPRGLYQDAAIHEGFPPVAGPVRELALGEPIAAPELAGARWEGQRLYFRGRNLTATTWLTATYPGGVVHPALPVHREGELCVDLTGLEVPRQAFLVEAHNPPPGGGRSAPLRVEPP
jgi:SAM-dependent methyltransferase